MSVVLSGAVLVAFALPAAAASSSRTYVVKGGDTLSKIATSKGLESWRPIYDANSKISNPNLIFPGQRLVIPAKGAKLAHRPLPVVQPVQQVEQARPLRSSNRWQRSTSQRSSAPRRTSSVAGGGVWDRLAQCESGGNWGTNTGNGYYGGLQFTPGSWQAAGGSGMPHQASRSEQIRVAQNLQQRQGWGAWPACSSKLGLR